MDAYAGYAQAKGIKTEDDYPTREELQEREREYEQWLADKNTRSKS